MFIAQDIQKKQGFRGHRFGVAPLRLHRGSLLSMAACLGRFTAFALFLLSAGACRSHIEFTAPLRVDSSFAVGAPAPEDRTRCELAAAYSEERGGRALLVVEGDAIVFEAYQNGNDAETPIHIFSGTKSFAGVMAVAAAVDGILDLDERVADTIPEFRGDLRKSKITVRQLLDFTSGLDDSFFWLTWDGLLNRQRLENRYAYALELDAVHEPGEMFRYGSSHLMVFGELMRRKLGGDPLAYLERRVLDPIGFRYAGWHRDPAGNPMFAYGAWTTAREWAKFGMLVRDDGAWRGKRILPPGAIRQCLQGSRTMPAYGLTFWLFNREIPEKVREGLPAQLRVRFERDRLRRLPVDVAAAAGYNDNRLYIIPERNLVVARLAEGDRDFSDYEFLSILLGSPTESLAFRSPRPSASRRFRNTAGTQGALPSSVR